jgi:plasmid replication initiation protein
MSFNKKYGLFVKKNEIIPFKSKTPKIYKNKKLNTANFGDFTHNDYQVFLHLVSEIGGVNEFGKYLQPEKLQREHTLTAKAFSEVFKVDIHHSYRVLKKAVDKLMKTDIKVERMELKELWRINVCSMAKYNKKEGCITIEFTDRIMPYLAQVRKKFTLYNLKEIAHFSSLYTTRLYELIQEFKETGWMIKSVGQLREILAVGNKFTPYNDFKKRTFAHACQEINDNYDMDLKFEEIKEGRKVVAVKFFFKQTVLSQRIDQAGNIHNTYIKPAQKKNFKKANKHPEVLEGQLSFEDTKPKSKNPFLSFISRLTSGGK